MPTFTSDASGIAAALPAVLARRSPAAFVQLLTPDVRWGGHQDTEQTCHKREQAGDYYAGLITSGAQLEVLETMVHDQQVLTRLRVSTPDAAPDYETRVLLTIRDSLVGDIRQLDTAHRAPQIELLFFHGCPNHSAFLPHLQQVLAVHGIASPVRLVEVTGDEDAQRLRFLGSPSLRIDGHDVEPGADARTGYGLQCRVYRTPEGLAGTPTDGWIIDALQL